jgi:acetate kinase
MREPILVINAGSSSIKFSVFETRTDRSLSVSAHGQIEGIGTSPYLEVGDGRGRKLADRAVEAESHEAAIVAIHDWSVAYLGNESGFSGVGHRVVHGGLHYVEPVLVDERVMSDLTTLVPLAPLHQPHNLAAIVAVGATAPNLRQVACFDTAFHRNQPAIAQEFALPRDYTAKGILRYGFHGLSYEYIVSALPGVAPDCADGKLIVAHLGNGASMSAIDKKRSIANTMSFTAVDGLPMGTRTGSLDPGIILYLLRQEGMDAQGLEKLIYYQSGLLGVSGLSSDMRTLLSSREPLAAKAIDLFVYRVGRELGSLAAALGGLDALVFTAGIGENAAEIRARVCRGARWLGIELDEEANARHGPRISTRGSSVAAFVVPTDENLMIARHTRALLDRRAHNHSER